MSLTDAGSRYRDSVTIGLGAIHAGAAEVAELSNEEQVEVVIACSEEVSHIILMPRYDALQKTLGERVQVRILTYHYSEQYLPPEPVPDVILTWNAAKAAPEDQVIVYREAVKPFCSPGYAAAHADTLRGPMTGWGGLTFLDLTRPNEGWASWEDWFDVVGHPEPEPPHVGYDSYLYLLKGATAGHGIALGWRHFIEHHLETGALVELADGYTETDNYYYCALTEKGRRRSIARKCLAFFAQVE